MDGYASESICRSVIAGIMEGKMALKARRAQNCFLMGVEAGTILYSHVF